MGRGLGIALEDLENKVGVLTDVHEKMMRHPPPHNKNNNKVIMARCWGAGRNSEEGAVGPERPGECGGAADS